MKPWARICLGCKKHIPLDAEVRYTTVGVYHEACYVKGGRRR